MGEQFHREQRIAEAMDRHGPDSPQATARPHREPHLHAIVRRVEHRLAAASHHNRSLDED